MGPLSNRIIIVSVIYLAKHILTQHPNHFWSSQQTQEKGEQDMWQVRGWRVQELKWPLPCGAETRIGTLRFPVRSFSHAILFPWTPLPLLGEPLIADSPLNNLGCCTSALVPQIHFRGLSCVFTNKEWNKVGGSQSGQWWPIVLVALIAVPHVGHQCPLHRRGLTCATDSVLQEWQRMPSEANC